MVVAFMAEGQGWLPLQQGLSLLGEYAAHGTWVQNLNSLVRNDESTFLVAGIAVVGMIIMLRSNRLRRLMPGSSLQVAAFCLMAFASCLIQYRARAYYHYFLLGLPTLVIAASVLASCGWDAVTDRLPAMRRCAIVVIVLAAFPLFYTGGNSHSLHVWRVTGPDTTSVPLFRQLESADDFQQLSNHVRSGSRMCVLPARYCGTVSFLLNTRGGKEVGYSWHFPKGQTYSAIQLGQFDSALLLHPEGDPEEAPPWDASTIADIRSRLVANGFTERLSSEGMVWYAKEDND